MTRLNKSTSSQGSSSNRALNKADSEGDASCFIKEDEEQAHKESQEIKKGLGHDRNIIPKLFNAGSSLAQNQSPGEMQSLLPKNQASPGKFSLAQSGMISSWHQEAQTPEVKAPTLNGGTNQKDHHQQMSQSISAFQPQILGRDFEKQQPQLNLSQFNKYQVHTATLMLHTPNAKEEEQTQASSWGKPGANISMDEEALAAMKFQRQNDFAPNCQSLNYIDLGTAVLGSQRTSMKWKKEQSPIPVTDRSLERTKSTEKSKISNKSPFNMHSRSISTAHLHSSSAHKSKQGFLQTTSSSRKQLIHQRNKSIENSRSKQQMSNTSVDFQNLLKQVKDAQLAELSKIKLKKNSQSQHRLNASTTGTKPANQPRLRGVESLKTQLTESGYGQNCQNSQSILRTPLKSSQQLSATLQKGDTSERSCRTFASKTLSSSKHRSPKPDNPQSLASFSDFTSPQLYYQNLNELIKTNIVQQTQKLIQKKKDLMRQLKQQKEQREIVTQQLNGQLDQFSINQKDLQQCINKWQIQEQANKDIENSIFQLTQKQHEKQQQINNESISQQSLTKGRKEKCAQHEMACCQESEEQRVRIGEQFAEIKRKERYLQECNQIYDRLDKTQKDQSNREAEMLSYVRNNGGHLDRIITVDKIDDSMMKAPVINKRGSLYNSTMKQQLNMTLGSSNSFNQQRSKSGQRHSKNKRSLNNNSSVFTDFK